MQVGARQDMARPRRAHPPPGHARRACTRIELVLPPVPGEPAVRRSRPKHHVGFAV